jgi:nicotinamidase-related amidase
VDLQERLLSGIHNKKQLLNSVRLLIQSAKLFEINIVLTEQVPEKLGNTDHSLSELLPSSNVVAKKSFSVFGNDMFKNNLKSANINHIVLCGIETSICIYLSAIDARKAGMEVTILYDCVGGRRDDDSKITLEKLELAGCHVMPLESFLYGLMGNTDCPHFKEISKLVKER